jgi:hypothetical protein
VPPPPPPPRRHVRLLRLQHHARRHADRLVLPAQGELHLQVGPCPGRCKAGLALRRSAHGGLLRAMPPCSVQLPRPCFALAHVLPARPGAPGPPLLAGQAGPGRGVADARHRDPPHTHTHTLPPAPQVRRAGGRAHIGRWRRRRRDPRHLAPPAGAAAGGALPAAGGVRCCSWSWEQARGQGLGPDDGAWSGPAAAASSCLFTAALCLARLPAQLLAGGAHVCPGYAGL